MTVQFWIYCHSHPRTVFKRISKVFDIPSEEQSLCRQVVGEIMGPGDDIYKRHKKQCHLVDDNNVIFYNCHTPPPPGTYVQVFESTNFEEYKKFRKMERDHILDMLPQDLRDILIMYTYDDLSVEENVQSLKLQRSEAHKMLVNLLQHYRKDYNVTLTPEEQKYFVFDKFLVAPTVFEEAYHQ